MMTICSILILLIHESGRVFHLLMLSSIYLFDVLMLLLNSLSLAWLELSSGFFPVLFYFALEAIVKGIISLISSLIPFSILYMKLLDFVY